MPKSAKSKSTVQKSESRWIEHSEYLQLDPESIGSIHARLARCITGDKGMEGILSCLAELTGCCAVFEGPALEMIAAASPSGAEQLRQTLAPYLSVKTGGVFRDAGVMFDNQRLTASSREEYQGLVVCRLTAAVTSDTREYGVLSLVCTDDPPPLKAAVALRLASEFLAIQASLDRRIARIELKLRGNFVEDLIVSNALDHDSILNRASALDYDISLPHRVLVGELDPSKATAGRFERDEKFLRSELVKIAQNRLNQDSGGLAVFRNNELILLLRHNTTDSDIGPSKQFAEALAAEISKTLKLTLYIGIGNGCVKLEDYKGSYGAAKKALEIGGFMITEGQVRSFEQFKIHALFLSTLKPDEQLRYAKSQLGDLLEFDTAHKTELIKTLQEFLYLRNNIEGTAKSINMSVSGLKYRLKKIEQIIGKELKDNKVSFDLQLALIIFQLFGEYRIRNVK